MTDMEGITTLMLHFPDGRAITEIFTRELSEDYLKRSLRSLIKTGSVPRRSMNPAFKPWSKQEQQYLIDNWQLKTRAEIATDLGRTVGAVKSMGEKAMGLKKSAEALQRIRVRPNGGQFKKGQLPRNTAEKDGEIRIRHKKGDRFAYKFLRISLGKWAFLQRHIWEQAHGPIPKSMVVIFKDGDTMNCDLSNLEMITKRENALRNQNREKASETMRQLYRDGKVNNPLINASDKIVAQWLYKGDSEMQEEALKHPELIEAKRQLIFLNREIKKQSKK